MEKTNLTILLTSRCTLKCKLCATYAPQNKKPCHYDSKIIMASVDKYFASMGDVCLFTLSGGEPLLHPDLVRMVQHFKQYASRMEKFEIITNGTIVPSEALLLALKEIPNVDVLKNMGLGIVDVNIMERMPMQGDGWIYLILATKGVQKKKIQNYSINVCIPLPFRDIFLLLMEKLICAM